MKTDAENAGHARLTDEEMREFKQGFLEFPPSGKAARRKNRLKAADIKRIAKMLEYSDSRLKDC